MDIETRPQRLTRILALRQETTALALESLLGRVVATAVELTDGEEAFILLLDPRSNELRFCVSGNDYAEQLADIPIPIKGSIAGAVFVSEKPLIVPNAPADPRHYREVDRRTDLETRSLMVAPLCLGERCIGVVEVVNKRDGQEFSRKDLGTLLVLTNQAAAFVENARLFEEVGQQREQLRALAARLAETEEAEQQRLARELHDLVGQDLTMLRLNLGAVRQMIEEAPEAADPLCSRLDDSLALVEQIAEFIRDVTTDLRLSVLGERGLVAALRWYGAQFASRTGVAVTVESRKPARRLPAHVENALFRIAQEALANVAKHAQATQVTLAVESNNGSVCLVVADNGVGFEPARSTNLNGRQGWGMLGMTERAEAIGGRCHVESQSDLGTRLVVEVPIRAPLSSGTAALSFPFPSTV